MSVHLFKSDTVYLMSLINFITINKVFSSIMSDNKLLFIAKDHFYTLILHLSTFSIISLTEFDVVLWYCKYDTIIEEELFSTLLAII
jgi:hypothetical protein